MHTQLKNGAIAMKMRHVRSMIAFGLLMGVVASDGRHSTLDAQSQNCVSPPSGLVSWWPGDGNANDIWEGNEGTLVGGTTYTAGMVGPAFDLNGIDAGVTIPHRNDLNVNPGGFSGDFWMKSNGTPSGQVLLVDKSHGFADSTGWLFQGNSNSLGFAIGAGGGGAGNFIGVGSTVNPFDGQWHHIAGTWDGSTIRFYVDGVLQGTQPFTTPVNNTRPMNIGYSWGGGAPQRFFDGQVDEVEIFNRALSVAEIQSMFNAGSAGKCKAPPACVPPPANMVSWWPGEGDANDIQNGNDGTLEGGTGFDAGKVSQAFFLDGIDDYVDAGNAPSLHVSSGDFTIDTWVKFNALSHPPGNNTGVAPPGDMSIIDKMSATSGATNADGWRLFKQDDNRLWFCLGGGDGNRCGSSPHTIFSTTVVTTDVWYHVAVVKTSTDFSMYVNGVLQDTRALPSSPAFLDSHSANLRLGSYALEGAHLNGLLDEVAIFNRALSQAEIQSIFDAGSAGQCKAGSGCGLDADFGTGGIVLKNYLLNDTFQDLARDSSGRIVAVGSATNASGSGGRGAVVARFLANGTPDPTFGSGGVTMATIGFDTQLNAVALQPIGGGDYKIVAAGFAEETGCGYRFVTARYNSNGTLDTSFDGDGFRTDQIALTSECGVYSSHASAVTVQSDGKIVTVGNANRGATGFDWGIVRYQTNGALDTTFDDDGVAYLSFGAGGEGAHSVVMQPDPNPLNPDRILVSGAGGPSDGMPVARYLLNGTLDPTFGIGGIAQTTIPGHAAQVAFDAAGNIVVGGAGVVGGSSDFAAARYSPDGVLDQTFGNGGTSVIPVSSGGEYAQDAEVLPDGRILLAGFSNGGVDVVLVRLDADGLADSTFGTGGVQLLDIAGGADEGIGLALDGTAALVSGYATVAGGSRDALLLRYETSCGGPVADTTPPVITPTVTGTLGSSEWYTSDVSVTWSVVDNESPISSTTTCDATSITTDTSGTTLTCSATSAGGTTTESVTIKRDATPPSSMAAASPPANANNWRNTDVTVSFTGSDALSAATCDDDVLLSSDGVGQSASGRCYDAAGNQSALATASGINIDKTPPTATGSAGPPANSYGWRKTNVTVTFSGVDALSGIAGCASAVILAEGVNLGASGYCNDAAGNQSPLVTINGINIDKTNPTITVTAPTGGAVFNRNQAVTPIYNCGDALSTIASCTATPIDTSKKAQNAKFTVTATDKAGNSTKVTVNYSVK